MIELNDDPTVEELIEESIQSGTYPFRLHTKAELEELRASIQWDNPKNSLFAYFKKEIEEAEEEERLQALREGRVELQ